MENCLNFSRGDSAMSHARVYVIFNLFQVLNGNAKSRIGGSLKDINRRK